MGLIQRQGIKNVIIAYAGVLIGFVNVIFIQPNFLTKEEMGLIRVLFNFSSVIAMFIPLGMGSITVKYFPHFRNQDKGHYGYFGFMLLFPLVGFTIIGTLLWLFKSQISAQFVENSKLFADYFNCVFPFILIIGFSAVLTSYAFSLLKTTVPGFISEILVRGGLILLTIAFFYKWFDLDHFIYFTITVYALQVLLLVLYILYEDKPSLKIDFSFLKKQNPRGMIRYGLMLSFASLTIIGLRYMDSIFLAHYKSLNIVGIYAIASFIPTVIETPLTALYNIANPKVAYAYASDNRKEIQDIYHKSAKYAFLIGGLLFLGVNINSKYLFQLLPSGFSAGINVVLIISIGALVNVATGINDSVIFNSKKYIYGTYMLLMLLVLAIINNIIFIPMFGMEGAALATALSSFIYNLIKYLFILKTFKLQPFDKHTLFIALMIVLCFGINYLLPVLNEAIWNIIFRSVIITAIYGAITYLLKIVPEFHHYLPFLKRR